MSLIIGIIIGIVALAALVAVHELGHAIMARRSGVVVEEFGIGFPPRAWRKRLKNGTLFTLNWLPLGGFVRLKGEYDAAKGEGMYGSATYWQKTKILLAGVFVNWIVAGVILTGLALVGMPQVVENQFTIASDTTQTTRPVEVVTVQSDSPAAKAGLQEGDYILRINQFQVESPSDLSRQTDERKGEAVTVTYQRAGSEAQTQVALRDDSSKGSLGVAMGQRSFMRSTWSAPIVGFGVTAQFTKLTLQGLGDLLVDLGKGLAQRLSTDEAARQAGKERLGTVNESVAGPLGIFAVIFPAAEKAGVSQVMLLIALISLTLAVMNMLPIPGLDGGRWFVMTLFRLLRKELTKEREEAIQATGVLILLTLIVVITVADVRKLL